MLNLKKVIASICVIAMVLTTVAFGATYTDVAEDSVYYEAVETLTKLGIVNGFDGEYRPEDGVTRAEMAKLIACIQGFGDTALGGANTSFTDVPSSHWASGYIANAASLGIINGYGDGTFGPEDPVLYEQAVKMIMAALGYTPYAEKQGGYPTGYLVAAQMQSVNKNVSNAAVGKEANRGSIAQLLTNAIDTPLMVPYGWNTNGEVDYVIADENSDPGYKTLMSENLGYVKFEGIVEETPVAKLGTSKTIDTEADAEVIIKITDDFDTSNEDFAVIGANETFLIADTDAADYIGYLVTGYAKQVSRSEFELVSITKHSENEELVIALSEFVAKESGKITYKREGNKSNDTLAIDGTTLNGLRNGAGENVYSTLATTTNIGEITFINNDGDSKYDVAIVVSPTTYVVEEVATRAITFKDGNRLRLDPDSTSKIVEIVKDGAVIDAADLVEWDVLSVYGALNANYVKAEVLGETVVGSITSIKSSTKSASGYAYKIGDNWYDSAVAATTGGNLDMGEGGTFYIDQFGMIAEFKEDAALATGVAAKYAYIREVKFATNTDFAANKLLAEVITADGVEVLTFKSSFTVKDGNGAVDSAFDCPVTVVTGLGSDNEVGGSDANADATDSVTNIVLNGKVDISKISEIAEVEGDTTVTTNKDDAKAAVEAFLQAKFNDKVVMYTTSGDAIATVTVATSSSGNKFATGDITSSASYEWNADRSRLEEVSGPNEAKVEADAIVFMIDADADECKVGSAADFEDKASYTVEASYKSNDNKLNDVIVAQVAGFAFSPATGLAVITGISTSTVDGETIYVLDYLMNGEEYTGVATVAKDDIDTDMSVTTGSNGDAALNIGDVVKVKVVGDVITDVKPVFNFADGVRDLRTATGNYVAAATYLEVAQDTSETDQVIEGGKVTGYDSKYADITLESGGTYSLRDAQNVYVIDTTYSDIDIYAGSDFNYIKDLYDGSTGLNIKYNGSTIATNGAGSFGQDYVDTVYVREYDDEVTDIIIVKGLDIILETYVVPAE